MVRQPAPIQAGAKATQPPRAGGLTQLLSWRTGNPFLREEFVLGGVGFPTPSIFFLIIRL